MANFQIFVPSAGGVLTSARTPIDWPGRLAAVGLEHLELESYSQEIPRGPDGTPGMLFSFEPGANLMRGYHPQTKWVPAIEWDGQPSGRYWFGYLPSSPPRPSDLTCGIEPEGMSVVLGDGQEWVIPAQGSAPSDPIAFQDGRDSAFVYWCDALLANYQLTPELVIELNMLSPEVMPGVIAAANQSGPLMVLAAAVDAPEVVVEPEATGQELPQVIQPQSATPTVDAWWYGYRDELELVASSILESEIAADGGSQLNIVFTSELTMPIDVDTLGIQCQMFSAIPEMVAAVANRSTGPGSILLFNDMVYDEFPVCPQSAREVNGELLSILAHELGHVVEANRTFVSVAAPVDIVAIKADIGSSMNHLVKADGTLPWAGHDANWLRACCWIIERLRQFGYIVDPLRNVSAESYGYPSFEIYQTLLAGEFQAYAEMPIRQILKRPMPVEFIRQWARDIGIKVGPLSKVAGTPAPLIASGGRTRSGKTVEIRAAGVSINGVQASPIKTQRDEEFQALRKWLKANRNTMPV